MKYQESPERVILGNDERKRDGVDVDASAAYWYGVTLDCDDVADYPGEIGVAVRSRVTLGGPPPRVAETRARWTSARASGEVRPLRGAP